MKLFLTTSIALAALALATVAEARNGCVLINYDGTCYNGVSPVGQVSTFVAGFNAAVAYQPAEVAPPAGVYHGGSYNGAGAANMAARSQPGVGAQLGAPYNRAIPEQPAEVYYPAR